MKLQKVVFIQFVISILTLLILSPGFSQVKKEGALSFSGTIDHIPADFKSIVVNEGRILISPDTRIVDEKGNQLKIEDLKIGDYVIIIALKKSNGVFAQKIAIKKRK